MLTGVEEKALSGRSDDMNEPIAEDMVGGESSEMTWYALKTCPQTSVYRGSTGMVSLDCCRCGELSSPTHLTQYINICDLSYVMEKWVEPRSVRLVKVGQKCKQEQRLERESPRLRPFDYLRSTDKPTTAT